MLNPILISKITVSKKLKMSINHKAAIISLAGAGFASSLSNCIDGLDLVNDPISPQQIIMVVKNHCSDGESSK